jgi:hypothetical protein
MRWPNEALHGVTEHEAGSVGAEQGCGGHHDLLQGGGQAALEIQVMEFADARGQNSRVDWSSLLECSG